MILEPLSHRQIGMDRQPQLAQVICRADPRKHEKLRRVDRAKRQDDPLPGLHPTLPAAATVFDPRRPSTLQHKARDMGAGQHRQIASLAGRLQILRRRVRPAPAPHRILQARHSFG